jgi:hypothetical protein
MSKCAWHLCLKEAKQKFCSPGCKNKYHVDRTRRRLKLRAIEYKGGKYQNCNYNKCVAALEFHHVDPTEKDFGLAQSGITKSWEKMKIELDKCILVCANCHREIHFELDKIDKDPIDRTQDDAVPA